MSFSVSLDDGGFEYSGTDLKGLLAQPANLLRPRFWAMVRGILRFYREAPALLADEGRDNPSLGAFLERGRYPRAFVDDHILPMGAAIWSASEADMRRYPARSFIRFFENHGLLRVAGRPQWRTVTGGSRIYVARMMAPLRDRIRLGCPVRAVRRHSSFVTVEEAGGRTTRFDHVVIAAHADDALRLLGDADGDERRLLGQFRYSKNRAVLHCDPSFMPRRRRAWASWNYLGAAGADAPVSVTYWMNLLQKLPCRRDFFVTLNPAREPRAVLASFEYEHPGFDAGAVAAQRDLWSLQGRRGTWFCGAHFGAGFHEDGLQSGLAVAEALGGVRRPWRVANESGRIALAPRALSLEAAQ
jgi:hypothetical protein